MSSSFTFDPRSEDQHPMPAAIPGIHVSAEDHPLFHDFLQDPFLQSHSFTSLLPDPTTAPLWQFPPPPGAAVAGPSSPHYAGSSNGSSEAASTSEAELFANIFAATSPVTTAASPSSPPPGEPSFLTDQQVFYVPVDDGRGGQKLAAIDWSDFRGFLANRPMDSSDLSKAARTLALCKPLQTTFSGVTPPAQGSDLLPSPHSPTGSSSPGHGGSRKLHPSNSGRKQQQHHHRGPRIRSLTEQHLLACPVEIEVPCQPLAVWWDGNLSRACVPELAKNAASPDDGRWIVFAPAEWFRVFLIEANTNKRTEVFPWSSKEGSNYWIRGQAMGIKECPCGEFSFFTHSKPDKDPFKRPSVLRKHFGECCKRPEEHPLRLLSQLQAGANTRARFHRASANGPALPPLSPPAAVAAAAAPLVPPPFTVSTSLMTSGLFAFN